MQWKQIKGRKYFEWKSISQATIPKTIKKKHKMRSLNHNSYYKIYVQLREKKIIIFGYGMNVKMAWKYAWPFSKNYTAQTNEINQIAWFRIYNWVIAFRSMIRMGTK